MLTNGGPTQIINPFYLLFKFKNALNIYYDSRNIKVAEHYGQLLIQIYCEIYKAIQSFRQNLDQKIDNPLFMVLNYNCQDQK